MDRWKTDIQLTDRGLKLRLTRSGPKNAACDLSRFSALVISVYTHRIHAEPRHYPGELPQIRLFLHVRPSPGKYPSRRQRNAQRIAVDAERRPCRRSPGPGSCPGRQNQHNIVRDVCNAAQIADSVSLHSNTQTAYCSDSRSHAEAPALAPVRLTPLPIAGGSALIKFAKFATPQIPLSLHSKIGAAPSTSE